MTKPKKTALNNEINKFITEARNIALNKVDLFIFNFLKRERKKIELKKIKLINCLIGVIPVS